MRGLICDDHPLMRQALMLAMTARWPHVAVSEASNYPEAWRAAQAGADFCVVDLAMPGADPLEGISRLRDLAPGLIVVALTGLTDPALLDAVRGLGVTGILPKTLAGDALLEAIEACVPGLHPGAPAALPPRRHAVLRLLGDGLTNKEIAVRLDIAPATVKIHVSRLIEQLGAANRTDAVSKAQRAGLI